MNYRLLTGDAFWEMAAMPAECVDLVYTDPDHGVGRVSSRWRFGFRMGVFFDEIFRVLKPSGALVVHASGSFTAMIMLARPREWRYNYVWVKDRSTGFLNAKRAPLRAHEDLCVFYRAQPTYNPQMTEGLPAHSRGPKPKTARTMYGKVKAERTISPNGSMKYPRSVLSFKDTTNSKRLYPTQKPLDLAKFIVATYTNEGDTVLDPFMGSGTGVVAAVELGRFGIGIEREPKAINIAKARLAHA